MEITNMNIKLCAGENIHLVVENTEERMKNEDSRIGFM